MNAVIMQVTLKQLLGRRRTILMALLAAIPVLAAAAFRLSDGQGEVLPESFSTGMLNRLIITALLPLIALIFGTAALGAEIEDGTAVYLLAKPLPRYEIVLSKLAVAAALTVALVAPATLLSALIVMGGVDDTGIVLGFTVAVIAGAVVYSTVFMLLSVLTSRALIAGLIYVFIWEGLVTGLFRGVRVLSVREYTLGIADALVTVRESVFEARLGGPTAIIAACIVAMATTWLATRRLEAFEIGETV